MSHWVNYAPLYYKTLEIEKDKALKQNCGDFDSFITIPNKSRNCTKWWTDNVADNFKLLQIEDPNLISKTDSSMNSWGCFNENTGEC